VAAAPVDLTEVDGAAAGLDRRLRRLHLARGDRRAIVDDVRGDLLAAAADGVRPEALIGPDVDAFAREAMEQGGYRPWRPEYARTLLGGVLGALASLFVAFWLVVAGVQRLFASWFTLDHHYPVAGPVLVYAVVTVLGVLGALVVLGRVLAGREAGRATVRRAALLLPAAVVVGAGAAVAVALVPDRPVGSGTVAAMVLCVAAPFVAALGGARWWALRAER
jgi:hypothetical protein